MVTNVSKTKVVMFKKRYSVAPEFTYKGTTIERVQSFRYLGLNVATPLWPSVGVKPNTPKVGDLESSGTPECLEFDSRAQNTLH